MPSYVTSPFYIWFPVLFFLYNTKENKIKPGSILVYQQFYFIFNNLSREILSMF